VKDSAIPKKNKNMAVRVIENETVLLPVYKSTEELNCIYTLNKDAAKAWALINGKRTVAQIKKALLKEFKSTEKEVNKKLGSLLKDLSDIKAIK